MVGGGQHDPPAGARGGGMSGPFDDWITTQDEEELCEIHDVWFVPRRGVSCPACRDDEADRRVDEGLLRKHGLPD